MVLAQRVPRPPGSHQQLRPSGCGRQRHQDRLDIAAGLQPEPGTAVVKQVEFDIAAAAHELMAALLVGPGQPHARPHDRRIDLEKRLADGANKGEVALPIAAVEIIEKDAAGAARLVAVRQKEILVAPGLEAGIAFGVVAIAGVREGRVKRGFCRPRPDTSGSDRCRRRTRLWW